MSEFKFFLASKCRICGKPLVDTNNNILCKTCQTRVRNYRWLTRFLGKHLLRYPLEELENEEDKKRRDDIVIAS